MIFTPAYPVGVGFSVAAADFDGTNDYMRRVGGLTGAADSKSGIFSLWIRLDAANGVENDFFMGTTTLAGSDFKFFVIRTSAGSLLLRSFTSASAEVVQLVSNNFLGSASWRHILGSWDESVGASARHLYIDDVSDLDFSNGSNANSDLTLGDWSVGAEPTGSFKLDGALAELYFAPGQYLDFSVEANRRKFRTASGKPAQLGNDGSLPTSSSPLVYLSLRNGEAATSFASNRGTGGDFTITGTLTVSSDSPSD